MSKLIRIVLFGLASSLALAGCQDKDFLNYNVEKVRNPLLNCRCPTGFTMNPAADGCTKETKVDPNSGQGALIEIGDTDASYNSGPDYFADLTGTNAQWPISFASYKSAVDANGNPVPETSVGLLPYWQNRVLAPNRISIASTAYVWHTKSVCVDIPDATVYTMLAGGDNRWTVKVDGVPFGGCADTLCFRNARFFAQKFASGKHIVEMSYYNDGGPGALWFEVYRNTLASLQKASADSDLDILFSTKDLVGKNWDYDGDACPPGYSYDACAKDGKCTKLEKSACL
ncbi:MAG: hypothetical protein JST04_09875 [Bdellovibrionales bacterium]|nr:hypothetical protein [Bdellovibrionales bacterium]